MDAPTHSTTPRRIIIVSDATGETARQMTRAALVQFQQAANFTLYKNVRTPEQVQAICQEAELNQNLIVHTIVSPELRDIFLKTAHEKSINCVDLLGPLLASLASYFEIEPQSKAGLLHDISESYFRRIEAMEYTIHHDDGKNLKGLEQADLVILGISRTSKTPLSMYLSHHGWRVANIPMISGYPIPEEVSKVNQKRVIGLTINSDELSKIRRARLQKLGHDRGGEYADEDHVLREVEYANEIFRKNRRWAIFDVTGKAVEETASEIVKLMTSRAPSAPFLSPWDEPELVNFPSRCKKEWFLKCQVERREGEKRYVEGFSKLVQRQGHCD